MVEHISFLYFMNYIQKILLKMKILDYIINFVILNGKRSGGAEMK